MRLVELRGGLNTIVREKAHHISRIDSNSAWTEKEAPKLPMYDSPTTLSNSVMGSPFLNRELQDFLWAPLFTAAVGLQSISNLIDERLQTGSEHSLPREKTEWCEDTFAATQHRIVSFPHPDQQMVKSAMHFRQNCWRCAAFIYFNTALRTTPASGLIQLAVERLIDSLQHSEPWTGWTPHSHILLWILFMGFVGAASETEKGLFRLEFRRVLVQLQLPTTEEVHRVLRVQVWRDVPLTKDLKDIMR